MNSLSDEDVGPEAGHRPGGASRRWALYLRSLASMRDPVGLVALDLPWWAFAATSHVEAFLARRGGAAVAFEYGPGASTVWLARRCARVAFVEHDARWWDTIHGLTAGLANARGALVEPVAAVPGAEACRSGRLGHRGYDYAPYVEAIRSAGGPFDIVVIDGRARAACLREAIAHLAPDGIILFDNSGRWRYRRPIAESGLAVQHFRGLTPAAPYPTQTSVLSVPKARGGQREN
ncbi:hypothetical protein [Arenibaculum sp.]|uniref:hypothetical protein n=1 Tax=Arenibaculum sp. TaxID=2865862 RepID=UPI002E1647C4|nr:hypothetical protein [Arenibaculum sp.]